MGSAAVLRELQSKIGVTIHGLNRLLGLKSSAHAWLLIKGGKLPSLETCQKIIQLGKKHDMKITLDMLRGEE